MQSINEHLLVVIDPSSPDGEAGLSQAAAARGRGGRVTLAALLYGPPVAALLEFADSEAVSVADAAAVYLEQVAVRLGGTGVGRTAIDGGDMATDLIAVGRQLGATAIVLPATFAASRNTAINRLLAESDIPVTVVPRSFAAV